MTHLKTSVKQNSSSERGHSGACPSTNNGGSASGLTTSSSDIERSTLNVRRLPAGFTLLEVILAIAITGFLLAAATAFVVSVSRIWVDREERHFFEDHVDGVTEFLQASFANAGQEIAIEEESTDSESSQGGTSGDGSKKTNGETGTGTDGIALGKVTLTPPGSEGGGSGSSSGGSSTANEDNSSNGGLLRTAEEPITWGNPPGFAEHKDPLLNFKLTKIPPLFVNLDDAPITGIDVFLHFEADEGLSFLWYSLLQEDTEDTDDLRRTEISPLVTEIKYVYWDESFEKWEEEDKPMEGEGNDQFILPRFIKLIFEYEGETKERTLTIPVPSTSVLLF